MCLSKVASTQSGTLWLHLHLQNRCALVSLAVPGSVNGTRSQDVHGTFQSPAKLNACGVNGLIVGANSVRLLIEGGGEEGGGGGGERREEGANKTRQSAIKSGDKVT